MAHLTNVVLIRFPAREAPSLEPPGHPSEAQLKRFMRAELPRAETARVVRHLLKRCQRCQRVTRRLWDLGEGDRR